VKYKGIKALLKCCNTCSDRKGIKCLGNRSLFKYKGYRFCSNFNPGDKLMKRYLFRLRHKISFYSKINYINPVIYEDTSCDSSDQEDKEEKSCLKEPVNTVDQFGILQLLIKKLGYVRNVVLKFLKVKKRIIS